MKKYDLIVIGGGFAGVGAALAAARDGAKTLIVDKSNCFGGAATGCLVNPFMPFSTNIDGVRTPLSRGIFLEIRKALKDRGARLREHFAEEELKIILNEMLEEAGVDILFHAYLCGVENRDGVIRSASFATKSGIVKLEADYFIDATGDAQAVFLAGGETILGRESDNLCQPMTLCFRVGNVDVEKFMDSKASLMEAHAEALSRGELINPRENILVFRTNIPNVLHFNTTRVVKLNPVDPSDVTKAELIARKQVFEIYEFMKKHADGLEDSYLMMTASEIGVRESRMIVGEYRLTEADCRAFTLFEDGIAACNYDIDIHNPEGAGTSHYYFPDGKYYTIPYRSLIPKGIENMLVAGRCISSDHGAQASYRIMPTVCCIGEAAGTAIAIAASEGIDVRSVDTDLLRKKLTDKGAFVG